MLQVTSQWSESDMSECSSLSLSSEGACSASFDSVVFRFHAGEWLAFAVVERRRRETVASRKGIRSLSNFGYADSVYALIGDLSCRMEM